MSYRLCFEWFICGACARETADSGPSEQQPSPPVVPVNQASDTVALQNATPASNAALSANNTACVSEQVADHTTRQQGQLVQQQIQAECRSSSGATNTRAPSPRSSANTAAAVNRIAEDLSVALMMACSVEIGEDGVHDSHRTGTPVTTPAAAPWDARSAPLAWVSSLGGVWQPAAHHGSHPLVCPPAPPPAPWGRESEEEGLFRMSLTGTTEVASEPRSSDPAAAGDSSSRPAHDKLYSAAPLTSLPAQPQQQPSLLCTGKEPVGFNSTQRSAGEAGRTAPEHVQLPQQRPVADKTQAGAATMKAVRRAMTTNCTYYVVASSPQHHAPCHSVSAHLGAATKPAGQGHQPHCDRDEGAVLLATKPSYLMRRKSALASGSCPQHVPLVSALPTGLGLMQRHSLPFTSHQPPPPEARCGQDYLNAMAYATGMSVAGGGTSSTTSSTNTSGGSSSQVHISIPRSSGRTFPVSEGGTGGMRVRSVPAKSPSRLARCTTNTDIPSSIDEVDI